MIKRYKHPYSEVVIHKTGNSDNGEPKWYVQDGEESEWGPESTEINLRIVSYWMMQVEIAELQNKIDSLTEWAEQVRHHDFEEYYKEYVQE